MELPKVLRGKERQFKIGKDLPEEEKVIITLRMPSLQDLAMMDINESDIKDVKIKKMIPMLASMLGTTEEDVGKLSTEYLEEVMDCTMTMMERSSTNARVDIKSFVQQKREQIEQQNRSVEK